MPGPISLHPSIPIHLPIFSVPFLSYHIRKIVFLCLISFTMDSGNITFWTLTSTMKDIGIWTNKLLNWFWYRFELTSKIKAPWEGWGTKMCEIQYEHRNIAFESRWTRFQHSFGENAKLRHQGEDEGERGRVKIGKKIIFHVVEVADPFLISMWSKLKTKVPRSGPGAINCIEYNMNNET